LAAALVAGLLAALTAGLAAVLVGAVVGVVVFVAMWLSLDMTRMSAPGQTGARMIATVTPLSRNMAQFTK
jgi:NADH:ubiquinone oxidoreductase subunit 6 (subunit J)